MSIFDWFRPLDKAIDVVDQLVVDKDASNALKAELQQAEMRIRAMAEQTYQRELNTKTIPWVDALHKMGRQILSVLTLTIGGFILWSMVKAGQEVTLETMTGLLAMSGPAGIYNYMKGKGK